MLFGIETLEDDDDDDDDPLPLIFTHSTRKPHKAETQDKKFWKALRLLSLFD